MPITISGSTGIAGVDGSASTPAVQGTDTNTGLWFPAADTIAWATGGTERARIDSSGNLQFNSGYGSVATAYGCRAWVNFNGTGTVAIRASGNVTSITDNGTGDYTVNFTNAMPDANYTAIASPGEFQNTLTNRSITANNVNSSSVRTLVSVSNTAAAFDNTQINVAIFR
jgi:hypothetical protein